MGRGKNPFDRIVGPDGEPAIRIVPGDGDGAPTELTMRAMLGGQQAQPNHFCRTGCTCLSRSSRLQASGLTERGFT